MPAEVGAPDQRGLMERAHQPTPSRIPAAAPPLPAEMIQISRPAPAQHARPDGAVAPRPSVAATEADMPAGSARTANVAGPVTTPARMPPVVSGWIGALPAAPAAEPARIAVITATIPADSAPSQGRHRSRRRVEGRAETRGLADKPSAINPPDTAPRNTLARPFAPVIAADRAPCKTKCSVVTNVTTAGLSSSGIPAARPL